MLVHHSCIPEDEESLLIELAEQEGVKDNEDGLEGWVAFQLLSKVSKQATKGFEILTLAVEDIIDQLSSKGTRILTVRSSNITQWRPEIQKWIQAQPDDVLLLQETHLGSSAISQAVAAVHKAGYEMFGGEAAPGRKGTHGGVAVLVRSHLQARTTFHFTVEGCGFSSVTLRIRGISLLLVSLYLKCSTPLHSAPNASILGRLASSLKNHHGHWLVAGDFNVQPKELAATSFLSEVRGRLVCLGEATTQGGSELDFAVTSNGIEGSVSIAMDWSAPHTVGLGWRSVSLGLLIRPLGSLTSRFGRRMSLVLSSFWEVSRTRSRSWARTSQETPSQRNWRPLPGVVRRLCTRGSRSREGAPWF